MTKFAIVSDIHQDHKHNAYVHAPIPGVDVMIVAGDLEEGGGIESLLPYIEAGQRVIFVPGNHEYYDHEINDTKEKMREHSKFIGVDYLDNDTVVINNVRIVGATLWTDYLLFGESEEWFVRKACQHGINDYRYIKFRSRIYSQGNFHNSKHFTPSDALELHRRDKQYLATVLSNPHDGPTVVVTHHAPSTMSVPEEYKHDRTTGAFASNLDVFIMNYEPDLWVHGHTHTSFDYEIGKTRVVCNPRGYHFEHDNDYRPFEIEL